MIDDTPAPAPADELTYRNLRWAALHTDHAGHGRSTDRAAAYLPGTGPWATLRQDTQEAWDDLHDLVAVAEVERSVTTEPRGWALVHRTQYLLMVDDAPESVGDLPGAEPLDAAHLDAIRTLAEECGATMFSRAAFALGRFHGVVDRGRLVALSGTRGRTPRTEEIVAVATVPDRQGERLAARAVSASRIAIRATGRVPYLQVLPDNTRAVRLYERLGFRVHHRTTVDTLRAI